MKNILLSLLLIAASPILKAEDKALGNYKIEVYRDGKIRFSERVSLTLSKETAVSKLSDVNFVSSCTKLEDGTIQNSYSTKSVGLAFQLRPFIKNSDGTIRLEYQVYFSEQTSAEKSKINKNICELDVPEFVTARQNAMLIVGKEPVVMFQSNDLQIVLAPAKNDSF
jgi:hypothetical protein